MGSPIYIAGLGAIASIGKDVPACLESLRLSRDGIGTMQYLSSVHKNELPVAEVKMSNEELAEKVGLAPHISRTALLSAIAAAEAIHDAALPNDRSLRIGFISANTTGGM